MALPTTAVWGHGTGWVWKICHESPQQNLEMLVSRASSLSTVFFLINELVAELLSLSPNY